MKRIALSALVFLSALLAVGVSDAQASRSSQQFGFNAGYNIGTKMGGVDFAANATDWFRIQVGYGFPLTTPKKFDAQLEAAGKLFVPNWDFSPYAGLGSGPASGTLAIIIGIDYQAPGGFNIGAGYSQVSTDGASGTVIYVGYFF